MSDYFYSFKRPKAEISIINKFKKSFEKSQQFYKNKDYIQTIEELKLSYNYLNDIWDDYPKIQTLFLMAKSFFYTKKYSEFLFFQSKLLSKILIESQRDKGKINKKHYTLIKIKAKILMYTLLINFISDKLDNCIESIHDIIEDLSHNKSYSLDDKIIFFWNYIKTLLKIAGTTKTLKFKLFKQDYDSMVIIEKKNIIVL